MPHKLLLALLLLTLLPTLALGWLGWRLAAAEQAKVERGVQALVRARLDTEAERIAEWLTDFAEQLAPRVEAFAARPGQTDLREGMGFILTAAGTLDYPRPERAAAGSATAAFLERTQRIWANKALLHQQQPRETTAGSAPSGAPRPRPAGWYTWHWGNGMNLLYWRELADGRRAGIEIDRVGLQSRLIGMLPSDHAALPAARLRLYDARGKLLYQWGEYQPAAAAEPLARLPLKPPLASWQLAYFTDPAHLGLGGRAAGRLQLLSGIAGIMVILLLGALLLYRELTRTMREAAQRVNFVNQVSHELKTPLTNIRLYAELLQQDLDDSEPERRRLAVIVTETQRLSRLIGNVLSFARGQRGRLRLRTEPGDFDACVRQTLEQFQPSLAAQAITLEVSLDGVGRCDFDTDALAQIVGNLLSNVEKYVPAGGAVRVSSRRLAAGIELRLADNGPGIPHSQRERIFRPFYRLRTEVTEGVSGTGIGLAIARDLARLHGGDLTLAPTTSGTCFLLWLPCARSRP